LNPFLKGLEKEGLIFRGVIYAGIMLTSSGLKVLEFNCRFGDPETQVVLPLLRTDFFDILLATATGKLQSIGKLSWREQTSACVVMASKGYPGKYSTGLTIRGLDIKLGNGNYIFHAGTGRKSNNWVTTGGRVLNVVGIESNLKLSLDKAYRMVKNIKFDGAMYRKDIGFRSLQA
ncbi:MAG: phosphoribosylglycinamide synthetase C domain-containing protein, partial [candidate division Zixibacteria bacterium]